MKKIVVIGAGVSGLSIARLLVDGGNKVSEFSATRIKKHFHTNKDIHVILNGISKQIKEYNPIKERIYDFPYYVLKFRK